MYIKLINKIKQLKHREKLVYFLKSKKTTDKIEKTFAQKKKIAYLCVP